MPRNNSGESFKIRKGFKQEKIETKQQRTKRKKKRKKERKQTNAKK